MKILMTFLLYCAIFISCSAKDKLNQPLHYNNASELFNLLEDYKNELSNENYHQLTNAIGTLKTYDTKHVSLDSFYQSLEGLSGNEIIAKAKKIKP